MKIIIQCAGRKRECARPFQNDDGDPVLFVARPEEYGGQPCVVRRPDDVAGPRATWRAKVTAYNRRGTNPFGLSTASELYDQPIYRALVRKFRAENVFILSAGWGLIRSTFLTPKYNITFSSQAERYARRPKRSSTPWADLNHLAETRLSRQEQVHFFGGLDYLPLLYGLTAGLGATVTVHHKTAVQERDGFLYEEYTCIRNQNWHYEAAQSFIDDHA